MLARGRDRLIDAGLVGNVAYVQANAERLPFADRRFDCVTIGFGLRNVTDKARRARRHAPRAEARRPAPGAGVLAARRARPEAALRRLLLPGAAAAGPGASRATRTATATWPNRSACIPTRRRCCGMMQEAGLEDCRYHNLIGRHRRRAPRLQVLTSRMLTHDPRESPEPRPAALAARAAAVRASSTARSLADRGARHHAPARRRPNGSTLRSARASDASLPMPASRGGPVGLLALGGAVARGRRAARRRRASAAMPSSRSSSASSLELLRPDLEEELSLVVGDVPAHQLGRLAPLALALDAQGRRDRGRERRRVPGARTRATWCRAPRASSSCAASMRCARTSIGSRRALDLLARRRRRSP